MKLSTSTDCFNISADDSTGIIDINGTKITKEFINAVSQNKNGYVVFMDGTIFYRKRILSVISKLFFDFRTVLWTVLLGAAIFFLVSAMSGCSLLAGMIKPDDPNKYYKPDTTLIAQADSIGKENDLAYDNMYGGVEKDTNVGKSIPKGIQFEITYDDSTKKTIAKLRKNVDSLQTILGKFGQTFNQLPEINGSNTKLLFDRMAKLKYLADSLMNNSKDSLLLSQLNDAKALINKNDSTMNDLKIKSTGGEKNTLIIGMVAFIIAMVIAFIFNNKKKS